MENITAIVLAAGRGTRMKSDTPKVLHEIFGKPIIYYVIDALRQAGIKDIVTVAGYGSALLREKVDTKIVIQKELLGSGDAVMSARSMLGKYSGDVIVICGDTPFVKPSTITELIKKHRSSAASLTLTTAKLKDPTGYGRILRDGSDSPVKIVEEINAHLYEEIIEEVNVGTYCYKAKELFSALSRVKSDNSKNEFFLTDTVEIIARSGGKIASVEILDLDEMIGVNSRKDLSEAHAIIKNKTLESVMEAGVTVEDPSSTTIYPGVKIGRDTVIHPNTYIGPNVEIGKKCNIGPFARLTANVRIGDDVIVGNFVEMVRSSVGDGARVKHHTYLGDTTVGSKVNVGAGTITANYDGKNKNKTLIEDGAFIGVGSILIAPVKIGKEALVGAGSVVLKSNNVAPKATVVGVPARILVKRKGDRRKRMGK